MHLYFSLHGLQIYFLKKYQNQPAVVALLLLTASTRAVKRNFSFCPTWVAFRLLISRSLRYASRLQIL